MFSVHSWKFKMVLRDQFQWETGFLAGWLPDDWVIHFYAFPEYEQHYFQMPGQLGLSGHSYTIYTPLSNLSSLQKYYCVKYMFPHEIKYYYVDILS